MQKAMDALNRGISYMHGERFDEAIDAFTEAIGLDSELLTAYHNRGVAYAQTQEFDKAIVEFTDMIRRGMDDAEVFYSRGLAYHELGDCDKAVGDYTETIRRNPDCWIAHAKLGSFILRGKITSREQLELALHHFEEALKLNPTDAKIFHNMGLTLRMLGRPVKGLDCFRKAVAVEPDSPYHQAWLGKALLQSGRFDEGIRHLREAVRLSPEDSGLAALVQEAERKYRRQLNPSP